MCDSEVILECSRDIRRLSRVCLLMLTFKNFQFATSPTIQLLRKSKEESDAKIDQIQRHTNDSKTFRQRLQLNPAEELTND